MRAALKIILAMLLITDSFAYAADTQSPAVVITSPASSSTVSNHIRLSVNTTDNVAVTSVVWKLDGATVASPLTSPPFELQLNTTKYRNGEHSLMAIARDAAGNFTRSSWIPITISNPIKVRRTSRPLVVEDLGTVLTANVQDGNPQMFRNPVTQDLNLLLYYNTGLYGTYPIQIFAINLTKGTARLVNSILGRPGPTATAVHPNGKVYLGTLNPGYLFEYDPDTGIGTNIGKLHPTVYRDAQMIEVGDDGKVYIAEYTHAGAGLGRFDPKSRILEDLGIMDVDFKSPQYGYTVGADTRYAFVGLGQLPWYLVVYDTQEKTKTVYWKLDNDAAGLVLRARAGGWFYKRRLKNDVTIWYRFIDGIPTEIPPPQATEYYDYTLEKPNIVKEAGSFAAAFNTEVSLESSYPSGTSNQATAKWRTVGSSVWKSATVSNFILLPVIVKQLYTQSENTLFGFTDYYGPVFQYDTSSQRARFLGMPQYELYDALQQEGDVTYLSGYTAVTLEYDPSKPWTLSDSVAKYTDTAVNPHKIPPSWGKYHRQTAFGADGLLYIGINHLRNAVGGELSWYDPITGSSSSLRDEFINDDVSDLKSALGARKLVYASYSTDKATNGKLFVVDVATKKVERTITPLPGINQIDKIMEVAPGIIFGANENKIFAVDIRSGAILYTQTLPGQALALDWSTHEYDHRLTLGPDGYIWMFIDNSLYHINPMNGSLSKIIDTPAKTVLFHGQDIYLYGGTRLFRIRGVLDSLDPSPDKPTNLRVIQ